MNSVEASRPPFGEDLDVVLSRFQSWARTQRNNHPGGGCEVREISYEAALKGGRHRKPGPEPASISPDRQPPAVFEDHDEPKEAASDSNALRTTEFQSKAAVSVEQDAGLEKKGLENEGPDNGRENTGRTPRKRSRRKARKSATRLAAQLNRKTPVLPIAAALDQPRAVRSFRDVLADVTTLSVPEFPALKVAHGSKSQTLTLRVSEAEQERIQACAAQANLSVSAYLRQCALTMDDLRPQLRAGILALPTIPEPAKPSVSDIPGILGRFLRGLLRSNLKKSLTACTN